MSEPVFLRHSRGLTLAEIATVTGAAAPVKGADSRRVSGIATLDRASPGDLVFLDSRMHAAAARATRAGACLTTEALAANLPADTVPLIVKAPYRAFVVAALAGLIPQWVQENKPTRAFTIIDQTGGAIAEVIDAAIDRDNQRRILQALKDYAAENTNPGSIPSISPLAPRDDISDDELKAFIAWGGEARALEILKPLLKPDAPAFQSPPPRFAHIKVPDDVDQIGDLPCRIGGRDAREGCQGREAEQRCQGLPHSNDCQRRAKKPRALSLKGRLASQIARSICTAFFMPSSKIRSSAPAVSRPSTIASTSSLNSTLR